MTPITVDLETYWSVDYSLSKMSFIEYIKGDQFEVISASIKVGDEATYVVIGQDAVGEALRQYDWSKHAMVAHNGNEFDFPAIVWTYDIHPALFIDTLCMARPRHQMMAGGSLKALSEHYKLPTKDNAILLSTKGKHLSDFSLAELRDMGTYNRGDSDNTYALFKILACSTPPSELMLSDMCARMICYPQFRGDIDLLTTTLGQVEQFKQAQLERAAEAIGALDADDAKKQLASNKKFAEFLTSLGIPVPMKVSKTTGKPAPALAKSDEGLIALQEHPNECVQVAVAARLGVKSTLLETRLAKVARCVELMDGWLPVPLAHHSATTGRQGGRVWNPQNLPRINPTKPQMSDALRYSLTAPPGHQIIVADLSGIELRVNHYLWAVQSTAELYASDAQADLYKEFAASMVGKPKDQIDKAERQLAKVAQLGLGFGAGASTFQDIARVMGGIELDLFEAQRVTAAWRMKYDAIVKGWRQCQKMISAMAAGAEYSPDPRELVRGCVKDGIPAVRLPSGRYLYYPALEAEANDGKTEFRYGEGRKRSKVYSGLMDENLVQAIARDVICHQALTFKKETGRHPALMVHDELVYVVPDDSAQSLLDQLQGIMRAPPAWLPGIVLWSEGDIANTYGAAK